MTFSTINTLLNITALKRTYNYMFFEIIMYIYYLIIPIINSVLSLLYISKFNKKLKNEMNKDILIIKEYSLIILLCCIILIILKVFHYLFNWIYFFKMRIVLIISSIKIVILFLVLYISFSKLRYMNDVLTDKFLIYINYE